MMSAEGISLWQNFRLCSRTLIILYDSTHPACFDLGANSIRRFLLRVQITSSSSSFDNNSAIRFVEKFKARSHFLNFMHEVIEDGRKAVFELSDGREENL